MKDDQGRWNINKIMFSSFSKFYYKSETKDGEKVLNWSKFSNIFMVLWSGTLQQLVCICSILLGQNKEGGKQASNISVGKQ